MARVDALEKEVSGLKTENRKLKPLEKEVLRLKDENKKLKSENERLKLELAAARKNSSNSSKPPSSDIVKPPPAGGKSKRSIGAQRGHEPHFRTPFTPKQLDETHTFDPPAATCPCGGTLEPCPGDDQVRQQIELRDNPLVRREYRARAWRCAACGTLRRGRIPRHVKREGFVGNRLSAALAFLNTKAHASHSALSAFMKDALGESLSRGQVAKTFRRVSDALKAPYDELRGRLRKEPVLNIDETGHREQGKRFWTWVFRAKDFTVFHIDKTRSAGVLESVLGSDYRGTIGCDYFSAYHKYLRDTGNDAQFCLAHLIRDIRFLREHPDPETVRYADRSLAAMRRLFRVHHRLLENPGQDRAELVKAGERLRNAMLRVPAEAKADNLARRFREHGDSYLRFTLNPEVEPTNNGSEQSLRPAVIDRACSQGTRSLAGREFKQRIWSVSATCVQRGVSLFAYLLEALAARAHRATAPPLLAP